MVLRERERERELHLTIVILDNPALLQITQEAQPNPSTDEGNLRERETNGFKDKNIYYYLNKHYL